MPQNLNVVKKKSKKNIKMNLWFLASKLKKKDQKSKKNFVNGALEFYKNETPKLTLRIICNCAEAIDSFKWSNDVMG